MPLARIASGLRNPRSSRRILAAARVHQSVFQPGMRMLRGPAFEHAAQGERTSACDHRHDGHHSGSSPRVILRGGGAKSGVNRARPQSPLGQLVAKRRGHQGAARFDSGRPVDEI